MTVEQLLADFVLAAPELALAGGAIALLTLGVFLGDRSSGLINLACVALLIVAAAGAVFYVPAAGGLAFGGALIVDRFAIYAKVVIALAAAASLLMAEGFMRAEKLAKFEFPILVTLATLGMMLMVSANDLITLYMGLELQSLALYVLAAFNRDSLRASEAGLKYFVLGALSSGLLLYGASLVYGFTGSTNFDAIAAVAGAGEPSIGLLFGLVFLISGLAFKVSAAPFHMWTPDVYEGAPTPVTALFAAAPKFAAMILFARMLVTPFPGLEADWSQVIVVIAALSMAVGAFGALGQTNIKRLMAYSSIANMGFALVPLSAGTQAGVEGMLLYMTIYVIATLGVFACILAMRRSEGMVETLDDLAGLSRTHPGVATAMTLLLFSIAGVPPLAGFFGKFFAFAPAYGAGLWPLVIFAVLMSVVAAVYYLKLVKIMWFDEARSPLVPAPRALAGVASLGALAMFPLLLLPFVAAPGRALIAAAAASLY